MYRITQFKPALYLLILLGIVGFSLAAQSSFALLLGAGGVSINALLVYSGRFRPIPRFLANLVSLGSLLIVARQLMTFHEGGYLPTDPMGNPVLIVGHFIVVLQLVKLWEQRLNRDYGLLLVLSLLLMVAASINTNRFAFGILLAAYLLLSLYCCLLFHLKVETDKARAANPTSDEKVRAAMLKQDQRYLARSMRRLTAVVSIYAITGAILTFLFFPRGSGNGVLSTAQAQLAQVQTGFSGDVSFDQIAALQTDDRVIAHAKVSKNGEPLVGGQTIYLRGISLTRYTSIGPRGQWQRDAQEIKQVPVGRNRRALLDEREEHGGDSYTQSIQLSPTGTRVLFAVSGTGGSGERVATVQDFMSTRDVHVTFWADGALQTEEPLNGPLEYEVTSHDGGDPPSDGNRDAAGRSAIGPDALEITETLDPEANVIVPALLVNRSIAAAGTRHGDLSRGDRILVIDGKAVGSIPRDERRQAASVAYQTGRTLVIARKSRKFNIPNIPSEVEAYALRPDVSGQDEQGRSLATLRREQHDAITDLDETIAQNIVHHLRTQFTYTLDITDAKTRSELDPIVWFLSDDGKRGHCEYFAGAMALMCQSLGIQARVVVGFKSDEYNPYSGQFVVKQSDAHAWVEVRTKDGWKTFDPTSSRGAPVQAMEDSWTLQVKHMFDWLESGYTNNVIYYSNDTRESLIQSVETQMTKPLYRGVNEGWITRHFGDSKLYRLLAGPTMGVLEWAVVGGGLFAAFWFGKKFWRRWSLRRRADRIGLDALPSEQRLHMALQLGFYDDLLQLLERRKLARKPHQTPMEFAGSLSFLPAEAYTTIHRLTGLFYRVRYGRQELGVGALRRLAGVVARLESAVPPLAAAQ